MQVQKLCATSVGFKLDHDITRSVQLLLCTDFQATIEFLEYLVILNTPIKQERGLLHRIARIDPPTKWESALEKRVDMSINYNSPIDLHLAFRDFEKINKAFYPGFFNKFRVQVAGLKHLNSLWDASESWIKREENKYEDNVTATVTVWKILDNYARASLNSIADKIFEPVKYGRYFRTPCKKSGFMTTSMPILIVKKSWRMFEEEKIKKFFEDVKKIDERDNTGHNSTEAWLRSTHSDQELVKARREIVRAYHLNPRNRECRKEETAKYPYEYKLLYYQPEFEIDVTLWQENAKIEDAARLNFHLHYFEQTAYYWE